MPGFEFWFSIGSTYTFLTVQRIEALAEASGIEVEWRPFSVRSIMQAMNNVPFVGKPEKERYMWRDLERRAKRLGIELQTPVAYPLEHFDRANRVAILASAEGWCENYVRASYRYWMFDGMPAGCEANLRACFEDLDQSFDRVLAEAESKRIDDAYREATARARRLGIFGSPSFVVDDSELFWGDDRLEDAIEYATSLTGQVD